MRSISCLAVTAVVLACGNGGAGESMDAAGKGGAGAGGDSSGGEDAAAGAAGESLGAWSGELAPATQIASGEASLLGVTGEDWVLFRAMGLLLAAPVSGDEAVKEISTAPGSVLVRGNAVFNWANVDWSGGVGVGDLSVWTLEGGTHELGATPYVEALVAASASGAFVVYTANTTETTTDLMIATSDFAEPEVLIPALGLGSEETCGASIGFVGERLFVGSCEEGTRAATLARYEWSGKAWDATLIADDALPQWSGDEAGERVFIQDSQYAAFVWEEGEVTAIDASVSRGQITPDGSAVFYTVGDQLRRSAYPRVNPSPIVTTGYKQPVGFSAGFDTVLYSTTVSYESGTRRDLLLAATDRLNSEPVRLVTEPVATLGRSHITADGKFVFYLTDVGSSGGTLHVVSTDGSEVLSLPNVLEVVAANGSTLVFSDNPSDPEQYPVVADLKLINLEHETEPRLVEEQILDGRNFRLDQARERVIYVRSGVDRDPEDEASKGLFAREIR